MGNASPKKVYVKPVHTMARRMVSGRWNQSKQPVGLVRFICWLSRCRRRAADLAIAISGVIGSEDVRLCMTASFGVGWRRDLSGVGGQR